MGTNCATLAADLFLFCYERDFMMYFSDYKQADNINAFNTTFKYLDDILSIKNVYFDTMVNQIYPTELQLNKGNTSDNEIAFLDLAFQGGTSFVDLLCFCSVLCLLCLCARLFICALWSPAGKGLTSWLSFEFVTFPLVSWVRCGT